MATAQTDNKQTAVIVNELNIRSADRGRKDITSWRSALVAAESVGYPSRTRLYDLYEDVMLDGHLSGIVGKRIDAVLNQEVFFEKNGRRVAVLDGLLQSLSFRYIISAIMETLLWGISGLEFLPGNELTFSSIPRKHIRPATKVIAYEQNGNDGIAYTALPNVWIMGSDNDLGLLLKCAPYYLYKRGAMADWSQFIELFGQPVRIIKYDSYDEQTRQQLKRILEESGSSLSMMIPRNADFDMKDGKQTNCDGNLQLSFIKAMNEEMSITILGNTETTTSSYSAGYAQSKVHLEQQYELTKSDLVYTANMLNSPQFLTILQSYGYAVAGGNFVFAKDMDIEYLKDRIMVDKQVAEHVGIADEYWYDTYGVR